MTKERRRIMGDWIIELANKPASADVIRTTLMLSECLNEIDELQEMIAQLENDRQCLKYGLDS